MKVSTTVLSTTVTSRWSYFDGRETENELRTFYQTYLTMSLES